MRREEGRVGEWEGERMRKGEEGGEEEVRVGSLEGG